MSHIKVTEHGRKHRRSSEETETDGEAWLLKVPIKAEEEEEEEVE
jgi:hypothetical protein